MQTIRTRTSTPKENGRGSELSRRGMLFGAAALAASRWTLAKADDVLPAAVSSGPPYAYTGCYTGGTNTGRGISVYHVDTPTNTLTLSNIIGPVPSPSYINLHPNKSFLYAGCEVGPPGMVMAFAVNPATGDLKYLSQQSVPGSPAHIIVHPSGKYVLTANYTGSTVSVLPIESDGSVGTPTQNITHYGDLGPNSGRQEAPHPHIISFDPSSKYVLINDLGLDVTIVYTIDTTAGQLTEVSRAVASPGSGPRHLAWHPNGNIVYSIKELNSSIDVWNWLGNGSLSAVQLDVSTLPPNFKGPLAGGEIMVASSGKFLYASNRSGYDSIAVFSIDQTTSKITLAGLMPAQGEVPRMFNIDPSGKFLHVTNQSSSNIVSYSIDPNTGMLTATGQYLNSGNPSCIQFAY
jgi:6-phosphogluconolactonase